MIAHSCKSVLKAAVIVAALAVLSGCALPYYFQAARGQVSVLRQREPIAELVAAASVDAATRQQLELVTAVRLFAINELGLPDTDSYTTYVDLGRDFVVWNVIAAPEFSVSPETWCFPVAGCVAYRGYFNEAKAIAFGSDLRAEGFDVFVGGSRAYSTLGHFADPVLNTMLSLDDTSIAAILFHEMAHQRVYVKNDTGLSESFASAVEQYGVMQWLGSRGDSDELARYRERLQRQREFAALVSRQRERLADIYSQELPGSEMLAAKQAAFELMREDYQSLRSGWGGVGDYDGWFEGDFNNASLAALTSYQRWVPGLFWRLEQVGPAAFYLEMEAVVELEDAARTELLESWNQQSGVRALANL